MNCKKKVWEREREIKYQKNIVRAREIEIERKKRGRERVKERKKVRRERERERKRLIKCWRETQKDTWMESV